MISKDVDDVGKFETAIDLSLSTVAISAFSVMNLANLFLRTILQLNTTQNLPYWDRKNELFDFYCMRKVEFEVGTLS